MRPVSGRKARPGSPFGHCSGSESEVSARVIGTYWFPGVVYEITLDPRPASPGTIVPSRNQSPPVELYLSSLAHGWAPTRRVFADRPEASLEGCSLSTDIARSRHHP